MPADWCHATGRTACCLPFLWSCLHARFNEVTAGNAGDIDNTGSQKTCKNNIEKVSGAGRTNGKSRPS